MNRDTDIFFSIIVPTYNAAPTILKCLDSVLKQKETSFEVLVIDGNSIDDTIQIVDQLRDHISKITVLSEPDSGIYDAMNKGIDLAKGTYLYFLGADDYLIDNRVLSDVKEEILRLEAAIIYGNVQSHKLGSNYDGKFDDQKIFHKNIAHQSLFFKKDVFKITGKFDVKYPIHADWDHNFKWFFDPTIRHCYIDRTMAHFADGGYSSQFKDHAFRKDFIPKYYLNARKRHGIWSTCSYILKGLTLRITR